MVASLGLAALALRAGLRLRRGRRRADPRRPDAMRRHLRLAKPAALGVALGFLGGPLSMALLRGRSPFGTAHAWIGIVVVLLFGATALLGRRLEKGRPASRDLHAALGLAAVLLGAAAAVMGFVLLP